MGFHTTPAQLANRQRKRFKDAGTDMVKVHEILATSGKRDFLALTSGRIPEKTLRAMGHPFAKQGVKIQGAERGLRLKDIKSKKFIKSGKKGQVTRKGVVRRLPINRQSGALRRAIQLQYKGGPQRVFDLYSAAPHAKYVLALQGTSKMVARGLKGPGGELRKRHMARKQEYYDVVRKRLASQ